MYNYIFWVVTKLSGGAYIWVYRVKEGKQILNKIIINTNLHPDYNIISQLPIICILDSAFIFLSDTLYLTCNHLSSVLSFYICCILFCIYLLCLIFYFFIISILSLSLIQSLVYLGSLLISVSLFSILFSVCTSWILSSFLFSVSVFCILCILVYSLV